MHDFDATLSDGRTVALEVWSATVGEVAGMWAAMDVLDWESDELAQSWSVALAAARRGQAGPRVRQFHREAPRLFVALEPEVGLGGGDIIGRPPPALSPNALAAIDRLKALGVRHASVMGTLPSARRRLNVGTSGLVGATDGSSINVAVAEACRDNSAKLARAQADERHLFMWVDWTEPASEAAMSAFTPPKEVPPLPSTIDVVWVGLWMRGVRRQSNIHELWRLRRELSWERVAVPAVRSYAETVTSRRAAGEQ